MDSMTSLIRRIHDLEDRINRTGTIDRSRAVVARAEAAAGQSIPTGFTPTIVDFGTVTFDPDAQITTGAAWKFTATLPGYYHVSAAVAFTSTTTWALGEIGDIRLYRDGSVVSVLDRKDDMNSSVTAQIKYLSGSDLIYLAAGQYVDIRAVQTSGAALALQASAANNYVSIFKVN